MCSELSTFRKIQLFRSSEISLLLDYIYIIIVLILCIIAVPCRSISYFLPQIRWWIAIKNLETSPKTKLGLMPHALLLVSTVSSSASPSSPARKRLVITILAARAWSSSAMLNCDSDSISVADTVPLLRAGHKSQDTENRKNRQGEALDV